MPSHSEILDSVREVLIEALGVDDDEVTPDSTLVGDLGAESIDFLDIVFRLEKSFDIKIPKGELFPDNIASPDSGFVADGKVTAAGLEELRTRLPHANLSKLEANPSVENIPDLFTVNMIVKYIENKIA